MYDIISPSSSLKMHDAKKLLIYYGRRQSKKQSIDHWEHQPKILTKQHGSGHGALELLFRVVRFQKYYSFGGAQIDHPQTEDSRLSLSAHNDFMCYDYLYYWCTSLCHLYRYGSSPLFLSF